jgi:hypothetical protein
LFRGDTHQVEQEPGADLRRQRRVGCSVEAEEHRLSGNDGVLERQPGAEVLAGDTFDDQAEASAEPGDALAFELAECVDVTAQSRSLG